MSKAGTSLTRRIMAAAALGLATAAVIGAPAWLWLGLDTGTCLLLASATGLAGAFLALRWFAAAALVLGGLEMALSAAAIVLSALAAIFGALS